MPDAQLEPVSTASPAELTAALAGRSLVIAAGAAGVVLLPRAGAGGLSRVARGHRPERGAAIGH